MQLLRRAGVVLSTVLATLALLLLAAMVIRLEDRLIFFPTRGGTVLGAGHDVWLTTDDGVRLHARFIEAKGARHTLLYLHGNAGNLADRSGLLELLATTGASVFALEYRGYGQSEGEPSETGLYRDAAAAYAWLRERMAGSAIVPLGESLGGGPACELSSTREVGGLILLSTFTSIGDMAKLSFPLLPTRLLVRTRFDNLDKIARVRAPKLLIHSRADELIPFSMAERLFAAAKAPKQHAWLVRSGHNDTFVREPQLALGAMRTFLEGLRTP